QTQYHFSEAYHMAQMCDLPPIAGAIIWAKVLLVPTLFLLDSRDSSGIWWSEIWQEGLLIFSFWYILSPAEFGHSRIETGMVLRLVQQNATRIWLFIWHMPIAKQIFFVNGWYQT
ncbi:hypothetical protein K443DRAFT_110004, partial [Laccaria amethystina LaAM-08-1]